MRLLQWLNGGSWRIYFIPARWRLIPFALGTIAGLIDLARMAS
jgi:hypothetical protein